MVLLDVALHESVGAVSLRDIARRQDISRKYLWQIVNPLKSAGILRSKRGTQGGYILARPPEDISLLDVVAALEAPVALAGNPAPHGTQESSVSRVAREAWQRVEQRLHQALGEITLQELVQQHKDTEEIGSFIYVI